MATKVKERILPHSIEAEQSVLGCVLIDQDASMNVLSDLKGDDFYVEAHRLIFEAMYNVYSSNSPVDFVTLTDELEKTNMLESVGGAEYIATLTNIVPSSSNFKHYVSIVKRNSVLRKLINASNNIINNCFEAQSMEEALTFAEKSVFDISQNEDKSSLLPLKSSTGEVLDKFEKIQKEVIIPIKQNESRATYFGNIDESEKMLDFKNKTAEELYATIRALHPWLPCYITIGKRFLSVNPYKCSCISLHESYSPGEIIAKDKKTKSLTIVCKCGNALKMEDLKLWGFWIRPFTKLFINNIKLNTTMD